MRQRGSLIAPAAIKATQKLFSGLLLENSSLKSGVEDLGCCLLGPWGIDQFFFPLSCSTLVQQRTQARERCVCLNSFTLVRRSFLFS